MVSDKKNLSVTEKILCERIDKYFYRDPDGNIKKYSIYCIVKDCKTLAAYNYEKKKPLYCNQHKKEKMINTRHNYKLCKKCDRGYLNKCNTPSCKYTIENYRGSSKYMKNKIIEYLKENKIEFYMCRISGQIVNKEHFESEEHINKFNSVCKIKIDKSLDNSFIKIKCKFLDTRYNYIYTDLYFKKHIKEIILNNVDTTQYYKSYIVKKSILEFNHGKSEPMYISYKFDSNNILNDISNIQYLEDPEFKDRNLKPYLIKNSSPEYNYEINKMYDDLDKINFKETGDSVYNILSSGVEIFITECDLLEGSNYNFEKIPKIFYNSKVISIIKNKDQKCFIYNYIRKYLNPVDNHKDRVSKKDKKL